MDILGSILKRMEGPPAVSDREKKLRQQRRLAVERDRLSREKRMKEVRAELTARVDAFLSDPERDRIPFEPMDKLTRALLHEVAEGAGLSAHSFGEEEVDRHVVLFKTQPPQEELNKLLLRSAEDDPPQEEEEQEQECSSRRKQQSGSSGSSSSKYLEKYEKHLGGSLSVAKDAAMSTKAHSSKAYGFVRTDQKSDKRTIEETLQDIRDKKRRKIEEDVDNNQ